MDSLEAAEPVSSGGEYRPHRAERPIQFSLRTLLLVTAAFALLLGLAVQFDMLPLVPMATMPVLAWFLWRVCRVSAVGVLFGLAGCEAFAFAEVEHYRMVDPWGLVPITLLFYLGMACLLVACVAFVVVEVMERRWAGRRWRNAAFAGGVLLVPAVFLLLVVPAVGVLREARKQHDMTVNAPVLLEIVADVEKVRERLRRAPVDEKELTKAMRKPMPAVSIRGLSYRVRYNRVGRNEFTLQAGMESNCTYESAGPNRGWQWSFF